MQDLNTQVVIESIFDFLGHLHRLHSLSILSFKQGKEPKHEAFGILFLSATPVFYLSSSIATKYSFFR
ncbi:Uncharacterised protein [Mycobacterium tuberculosis]|nr:Uncharacterised protein [Mycobacterium tuberculosis]